MDTREPPVDEASLTAQLAGMAPPAEAEAVLTQLASALFPDGVGSIERVTWSGPPPADELGPRAGAAADTPERTEARLRAAEARYRTLVEQIPAVTFMTMLGEGRNEVYVSPHIEALLGYTQAQWLEDPFLWYRQLHPDDRAVWIDEFARGCRTGGPFRAECRFLARDGHVVWVRGEARLVKDDQGRPLFLQGVAFDITESRRAQELVLTQAVRTTEERYRDVVDGIGAIFWEADPVTLQFTFVSEQAERLLGFPRERWLADPQFWMTMLDAADADDVSEAWRQALAEGREAEIEYRVVTASGEPRWLHNRVHVVRGDDGRARHLLGFIVDITERKRAETERARLLAREREARAEAEALYQISRQLASQLEIDALAQAVTDAGRELTGAAAGAFVFNPGRGHGDASANVPAALLDATFRGEGVVRLDDRPADPHHGTTTPDAGSPSGERAVRSYLAVPVKSRSGDVLGGLFLGHPEPGGFTERHARMLTGLAAHAAVAMDNARLYQSAQDARETAERANRAKDEFLATLSHELRTPLNAILGWARILRSRPHDAASAERALEVIERNASSQAHLIEDLLDVSRIIVGKFQIDLRPIRSVAPIVETVVDSLRPTFEAKRVALDVVVEPDAGPIAGDPARLQQIVWNLISNAVKFTPAGRAVRVSCRQMDGLVEIRVSDSGQGIPPSFLPHLFNRFSQADSTSTRTHGGLGIGLSIVRHLVELHGGAVHADSPGEDRGATFTVTLPIAGAPEPAPVPRRFSSLPPLADRTSIRGLRVVVVEDDEDSRVLFRAAFEREGALVEGVGTANAALEAIQRWKPDVIVIDIGLPGEDGYSLIRRMRALPPEQGGGTPALALTAYASMEDRRRALAAGFQVHLAKPADPAVVVATVAQLADAPTSH